MALGSVDGVGRQGEYWSRDGIGRIQLVSLRSSFKLVNVHVGVDGRSVSQVRLSVGIMVKGHLNLSGFFHVLLGGSRKPFEAWRQLLFVNEDRSGPIPSVIIIDPLEDDVRLRLLSFLTPVVTGVSLRLIVHLAVSVVMVMVVEVRFGFRRLFVKVVVRGHRHGARSFVVFRYRDANDAEFLRGRRITAPDIMSGFYVAVFVVWFRGFLRGWAMVSVVPALYRHPNGFLVGFVRTRTSVWILQSARAGNPYNSVTVLVQVIVCFLRRRFLNNGRIWLVVLMVVFDVVRGVASMFFGRFV